MRRACSVLLALALLLSTSLHPTARAQVNPDIDGDGINDTDEDKNGNHVVDSGETDWRNADTDRGGEADGAELRAGRDPLVQSDDITFDADGDGLSNGEEVVLRTDLRNSDSDGDGANDKNDPFPLESAYKADADHDGIADEWEAKNTLSPATPTDATVDTDKDGLENREEFIQGTNPLSADTDRDGETDGAEVEEGSDPQESGCLSYREDTASFPDVTGHWAEGVITVLRRTRVLPMEERIVTGYVPEDGSPPLFLPDRPISRNEFLKIAMLSSCIKFLGEAELPSDRDFPDYSRVARPRESRARKLARRIVYTAVALGVIEGYGDGTFRPHRDVSRAEALKILLAASNVAAEDGEALPAFSDVPADAWFAPAVSTAVALGLVEGYGDGTFRPHQSITRAEAAKIVVTLMRINPNVNGYTIPSD